MQESLCEKWFLQHFMDTDAMLPAIDAMDREIWKELPQPTLSKALSLWQWGVERTNGGKDGGPSLRSGMGFLWVI